MATARSDPEHNNWLMIGEALLISKTALEPYTQHVVNKWHQWLLDELKNEGSCSSRSKCKANKVSDLCKSCKAWYNELRNNHKGKEEKISWDNTDCTQWAQSGQGWEVAKVFMANLGERKSQVVSAKSTDIAGLLTVLRFFPDNAFGNPVLRPSTKSINDVTNHVRNLWAHSPRQGMNDSKKKKAMCSLKSLLTQRSLKGTLGNQLNELKELEHNGIVNISSSEFNCFNLLLKEMAADLPKIKADIKALTTTSKTQEREIQQLKTKIDNISSAVDLSNQKLEDNSCDMQKQLSALKEEVRKLKNELELKLANLEANQDRLETRQDQVETRQDQVETRQDQVETRQDRVETRQDQVETRQDRVETRQDQVETRQDRVEENLGEVNTALAEISERVNSNTLGATLQTHLPDFQDKVFGRDADIDCFAKLIKDDKKPCVVLFGAPGFGKTTVVINLAHKLKEETNKVFLFVSLREMRSIKDIYRELLGQVGRHPREQEMEELLQWTRSLKEEVVFILDNAEDALQGNMKDGFCDLLQKLRSNSRFIQFVITSRERFSLSAMEVTCKEIKELNLEEGTKVICSMTEGSKIPGDSDALTKLACFCGGIPLALKMIGSLLNYVDDTTSLLEELKSFPMETLEDTTLPHYHQSLCVAFECSFKRLHDCLRTTLVRLSVFKGPFTQAAAAKILDCQKRPALAGKRLKELTDKALLSRLDTVRRYEMHSLIQKYLLDVKRKPYQDDLVNASNNFTDYYLSLVVDGRELFWSKDKFKHCIQMFRDDKLNIEIALEMCYQDARKMKQYFLPIVWSVCMYLEMCISLDKLNQFLESCSTAAKTENEKGTEMEAQCFLAYYEWKKAGISSEKYKAHFKNAKKLFEEEEPRLNQSQKWLYKHSHGMRLDQEQNSDEALRVTKHAVEIAEKNASTTDLPLTLNLLGHIEKHRKDYPAAESCFNKSHEERKKVLGENHILSIPKYLADLYLQLERYDEALSLYERGLETYKFIAMNNEKQCIYLLKNMGYCCLYLKMLKKSLNLFNEALNLAEMLLDGDHKVKVLVYEGMVKVYLAVKNKPEALKNAQKAIQMADRLKLKWGGYKTLKRLLIKGEI